MRAKLQAPPTGQSSAKPPTHTNAREYPLKGPSESLDPRRHAYRKDLADIALADRVIASHYAEPLDRVIAADAVLRAAPSDQAEELRSLQGGEPFAMLDNSVGWAWGYAGEERLVGYVRSEAVAPA